MGCQALKYGKVCAGECHLNNLLPILCNVGVVASGVCSRNYSLKNTLKFDISIRVLWAQFQQITGAGSLAQTVIGYLLNEEKYRFSCDLNSFSTFGGLLAVLI